MAHWILLALAVLVGVLVTLQAGMLVVLQRTLGSAIVPVFASFAVGTLATLGYVLASRQPWPAAADLGRVPPWLWLAGAVGALLFTMMVALAPRLGAGTLMALIVAGQLGTALLFDHFGAFGLAEHPIGLARIAGVALIVVGALLIEAN